MPDIPKNKSEAKEEQCDSLKYLHGHKGKTEFITDLEIKLPGQGRHDLEANVDPGGK